MQRPDSQSAAGSTNEHSASEGLGAVQPPSAHNIPAVCTIVSPRPIRPLISSSATQKRTTLTTSFPSPKTPTSPAFAFVFGSSSCFSPYAGGPRSSFVCDEVPEVTKNPLKRSSPESTHFLPCNCKRSGCVKMYCECFKSGRTCQGCNCVGCDNVSGRAVKHPVSSTISATAETKGCNCKRTRCLKKYCDCYQQGKTCGKDCRCENCENGKARHAFRKLYIETGEAEMEIPGEAQ